VTSVPYPFGLQMAKVQIREPLHFIVITVMSVMSGTFPDTYGVLPSRWIDGEFGDRHVIVM